MATGNPHTAEPSRLHPADIEALADAVAERLAAQLAGTATPATPRLVDATTLADLLGVSRGYVYANADGLGAVRLGDGPRARLRFDPAQAAAHRATGDVEARVPRPTTQRRARRRTPGYPDPAAVLPLPSPTRPKERR